MATEDKVTTTPTDGEIRILMAIFAHMSGKPDVDWDAAAAAASLSNAKSIKERYRQMCVRHGWNKKKSGGGGGGAAGNAPSTPRKMASPSEVVKSTGGGKKRKQDDRKEEEEKEEEEEEDDDDDEV